MRHLLLFLTAITIAADALAASGWTQIKAGMAQAEAVAAIGDPLVRSKGRQFELWIYDHGAEVVCFRGTVVAWTAPAGSGAANGRDLDLRGLLEPPPEPVKPAKVVPVVVKVPSDYGYQRLARQARLPRL